MNTASLLRLLLLSAIWGASFLFMRIGAPALGPILLILLRVGLAAIFLTFVALHLRKSMGPHRLWKHYFILGLFNSALPFVLFAFAAQTVSASLLSVLNATAPLWATVLEAMRSRSRLSTKVVFGLMLGMIGVGLLAGVEALSLPGGGGLAIAAGLSAAASYGLATVYAKSAPRVEPLFNAQGSMFAASVLLAPALWAVPWPSSTPSPQVILATLALGIICSGVAYLLYFRLIADLGAASALTVTFLIPVFGILWGALFLRETVGWHTLLGSLSVLTGTAWVTGFSLQTLRGAPPPS